MAYTYVGEQRHAEAIPWLRRAVARLGQRPRPQGHLADALLAVGETGEAIEWYERSLAERPAGCEFRPRLAGLHEHRGNAARALELFREEARAERTSPEAWFLLGDALLRHGAPRDEAGGRSTRCGGSTPATTSRSTPPAPDCSPPASPSLRADVLRDAVRAKPDYAPAHNNLGKALLALGRPAEARAAFAEALRVQPASARRPSPPQARGIPRHDAGCAAERERTRQRRGPRSPVRSGWPPRAPPAADVVTPSRGLNHGARAFCRQSVQCPADDTGPVRPHHEALRRHRRPRRHQP
jgi:tetratricopeptide (TPR) repeat protein